MRPLVIYFNELSSPRIAPENLPEAEWRDWTIALFSCLRAVSHRQEEFHLAFVAGHWHSLCGGKPLSHWITQWIGKGNYQWLLPRVKNVAASAQDCEIYFKSQKGEGLTYAYLAGSWSVSFGLPNSPWSGPEVTAIEVCLGAADLTERECTVRNLGSEDHVRHWERALTDWGQVLASTNVIATLAGYPVMMYPYDHSYPHVHLVDLNETTIEGRKKTLAKYRIDPFERMEGHPRWDSEVRPWIERHHADLLNSWNRCQLGEHPLRIG